MRIQINDIREITTDISSDDKMDHGSTIVLKCGMGIIIPHEIDAVFIIKLCEHDENGGWEFYLVFNE